jgi:nitrous oxidase accessory protein
MDNYQLLRKYFVVGIVILFAEVSYIPVFCSEITQPQLHSESTEEFTRSQTTIRVDDEGDGDYTKIQDALDNASNGDTIMVYSGIYHENVFVEKSLALIGIDKEFGTGNDTGKPILDGTGVNDTGITIDADGTLINGFFIRDYDSDPPYSFPSGIFIASDFTDISNNVILNIFRGIWIFGNNNRIYENEIQNVTWAVSEEHCANNKIYQNRLFGQGASVFSLYCQNTEIDENNISSIYSTLEGIYLMFTTNTKIHHNFISITGNAVGIDTYTCKNIIISFNTISCDEMGIQLANSDNNIISYNKLQGQDNFYTIVLLEAFFNKIISNDFGTVLTSVMLNSLGNTWFNNYYPCWPHGVPRVIPGVIVFGMPYKYIPYVNIDWLPARHPHFP